MGTDIQELLALDLSERAWIRNLPNSLADLVRLIGVEPTLRLALHYGGSTVQVPKAPYSPKTKTPSVLVGVIGEEAAAKLCEQFADCILPIPSFLHGRMMRRLRWMSAVEKGLPEREAAQAAGICKSTHYEWKRLYLEPAR